MGLRSELKSALQQAAAQGKINLRNKGAVVGFVRDYATQYRADKSNLAQSAATTDSLLSRGISPQVYSSREALSAAQAADAPSVRPSIEGRGLVPPRAQFNPPSPEPRTMDDLLTSYTPREQPTQVVPESAQAPVLESIHRMGIGLRAPTDQEAAASGRAPFLQVEAEEAQKMYEWSKANPKKASAALATFEAGGNMSFGGSDLAQRLYTGRTPEQLARLKAAMSQGVEDGGGVMAKHVIPGVIGVAGFAPTLVGGGGITRSLAGGSLPNVTQRALGLGMAGMAQDVFTPPLRELAGGPESVEDPMFRAARGFTGGASAVAGTAAGKMFPGLSRVPTIIGGDAAASAAQAAAFAPEGRRGEAAITGGLFGAAASALGARGEAEYLRKLEAERIKRLTDRKLLPAPEAQKLLPAPETQKLLPEEAVGLTPELRDQMARAYELQRQAQEAPIPMPGPVQEAPFTRIPPPELQPNRFQEQRMTFEEEAQMQRLRESQELAARARERSGMVEPSPEMYGIDRPTQHPMLPDIGGSGDPPIGPNRAPPLFPENVSSVRQAISTLSDEQLRDFRESDARAVAQKFGVRDYTKVLDSVASEFAARKGAKIPEGTRQGRAEVVDPKTLEGEGVREMYSGIPVPKDIREPIGDIVTTAAKGVVRGYTDPVGARRDATAAYEKALDRVAHALAKMPVIGRLFRGAAASRTGEMKAFRAFQDNLTGEARLNVQKLSSTLAAMTPAEQRMAHYAAERRTSSPNAKVEEARIMLQNVVDDVADEYIRSKILRPETVRQYQVEGQQGYVKRIPGMQALKDAIARGIMHGVREAGSSVEPKTNAERIYHDANLAKRAESIEAEVESIRSGRKQMTLEQAEALGYKIGAGPLMATMKNAAKSNVVLKTMRYVHEKMPTHWREPPAKPEGAGDNWKPTAPPGWRLAEGLGWGVLNGKLIRADVFGDLQHVANPRESGWWKLAETVNRIVKTGAVFGAPSFYFKTQMLLNSLTNSIVMPPESVLPSIVKYGKAYKQFVQTGEMTPAIKALVKLDQLTSSRLIQEMEEGADRGSVGATDYRDIPGGKGYFGRVGENFGMESARRADLAETRPISDEAAGGRLAYHAAEKIQAVIDLMQGLDAAKAAGVDTTQNKPGLRAKFSMEGLMDLASMQDNLFKVALAEYLVENGPGALGAGAGRFIKRKLGKGGSQGLTPDEAAAVVRDFYDVREAPKALRYVANVPVVGQAFIRWPYLYARNLLAKGYGANNPLMGLLYMAPVAILTGAYAASTGKSDEEIEEMRKAANASETSAPISIGGKTFFFEVADLDALHNAIKAGAPGLGVKPGPDGGAGRVARGILGNNPLGRYAYQQATGRSTYTGKVDQNASAIPPLPLPFFSGGMKLAERAFKREDMLKQGRIPPETEGQELINFFLGIGLRAVPDKSSPRYWNNVRMWESREAQQEAWDEGARTMEMPVPPRKPRIMLKPKRMPKHK